MTSALLALALAASAWSAPKEAFPAPTEGQRLYDLANYKASADFYREALAAQPRNAGLHYDLGNALFKAGQTGRAIAAFQRAFDISPRDADIRQNLDFALRRAGEELVPSGTPPLLFLLFHVLSEKELAGLQTLACWLTLILAGLCLWRASLRPRLAAWTAAAAGAWLVLAGWWLTARGLTPQRRGVITASAEIRSGPGENFNVSFTAPEGRRVRILSEDGEWLEIGVLKEGVKGWIAASAVEEL